MAIGRTNAGGGASLNFKIVSGGNFPPSMTRNMIPDTYAKTATYNGITYTVNGDGSITANGTATATSTCNVWGENNSLTLPAGTHTLSGCPAGGSQNTYMLCSNDTVRKDTGSGASFTLSADTAISFKIRIASGTTVSNLKFWPQLEQGSTKTSFVKYAQKENTIWVNTSVAIPSWAFSATEPGSPVAGMVWIITSTSSQAEFNALKKNTIQVYPTFARQYVGGQWVERDAQCYQDGEWKDMVSELYIVENGILKQEYSFSVSRGNNARQADGHYSIYGNGGGYHTAWIPNIDLTRYRTLSIDGTFTTGTGWELCVWDKATSAPDYQNHVATADLTATGAVLDVSGLTGEYSVGITNVYTNETLIVNMWLG